MKFSLVKLLRFALIFAATPAAMSTTWYVDGVSGKNTNNCKSHLTACKTIGHAISLASSDDSILVASATYFENLTIGLSLKIIGASASTTIIDGRGVGRVIAVNNNSGNVALSRLTIRNGRSYFGGGVFNGATLTINACTISGNIARGGGSAGLGAGVGNAGVVTISNSTINGNTVSGPFGAGFGGGVGNTGRAIISNSTLTGNVASGWGGGIGNEGTLTLNNSTVSGNTGNLAGNTGNYGGGIGNYSGSVALQNSIVSTNSAGNCYSRSPITSKGFNLSSDDSCHFASPGDINNTDPMLGPLQNNDGPTQTMELPSGSPAIDAGNPSGCTDGHGNLLKTDQRGQPRPDKEDKLGCDMGAYERQSD
jgi:hypothetical protein